MARPLRIYFEGAWYHVMSRGVNHGKIFFNDMHRYAFLNLLGKTKEIYNIEIHAYCLMSNHYHLIIRTPNGNISQAMKYLNASYAQFVNLSMGRDGPLFKGRFKAILISADEYLIRLSRYIHLNPLEAKVVISLLEYKWSSYLAYIEKVKAPEWLCNMEVVKRFGSKSFNVNYRKFVEIDSDNDINKFYQNDKIKPIIGGDDFCRMIDEYIKSHSLSAEIVGTDQVFTPPSFQIIINAVSNFFGVDTAAIFKVTKKSTNKPRQIAIFICRNLAKYTLNEISDAIGNIKYKGISKAIARVNQDDDQLKIANKLINELKSKLKG